MLLCRHYGKYQVGATRVDLGSPPTALTTCAQSPDGGVQETDGFMPSGFARDVPPLRPTHTWRWSGTTSAWISSGCRDSIRGLVRQLPCWSLLDIAALHCRVRHGLAGAVRQAAGHRHSPDHRPRARKNADGLTGFSAGRPGRNWIRITTPTQPRAGRDRSAPSRQARRCRWPMPLCSAIRSGDSGTGGARSWTARCGKYARRLPTCIEALAAWWH